MEGFEDRSVDRYFFFFFYFGFIVERRWRLPSEAPMRITASFSFKRRTDS